MIGADTSFLVGLAVKEHPLHDNCWNLFKNEIVGVPASLALTPQVLAEFAHVVTDPRRFERPLTMDDALTMCKQWWHAQECRPIQADFDVGTVFLGWMSSFSLGRKRLLDTLLAASFHSAGVRRIATTNWRDFQCFDVFEPVLLERL